MKNYFRPLIAFTKANLLRFFRDKVYIFFMLFLPAMFLLLFGMIYSGDEMSTFSTAIFNNSSSQIATSIIDTMTDTDKGFAKHTEVASRAEAEEQLIRGEISAIIEFPENFGQPNADGVPSGQIKVSYDKSNEQSGQSLSVALGGIASRLNAEITGISPAITVSAEASTKEGLKTFDYVFAGLLGYTVLTIGLMGIANILPGDKESGATKRLRATTVRPSQLILSYALTFLIIGVLCFLVMIGLGLAVFHFNMRGNWLNFAVFTAISTIMMLGFGLAVGGGTKNEAQASAASNLIMFPMMFLSGIFIPLFLMPAPIQIISGFMPLTPVINGIRLIITENYSLLDVLPQLGIIAVWGIIIYAIAIKTFRWE